MPHLTLRLFHAVLALQLLHAVLASVTVTSRSEAARSACAKLSSTLGPALVQSSGIEYAAAAGGAWNAFNDQQSPSCVVFPTETEHVVAAMKAIYAAGATYAVQAGGHSGMQGWNNVENGVLISFSNMASISYDAPTNIITLEPGARWSTVYDTLEPFGVAPVGGRCNDVGTGLLVGGGLSWLSPQWGYATDQIRALDVVLVNGTLVTATAVNEYSDLFRAIKGGGNRFGVVARYELNTIHTGTAAETNFFGGVVVWDANATEALLNATADYVATVDDPKAVILITFTSVLNATFIQAYLFYNGTSLPPSIFSSFLSVPPLTSTLGPISYHEMSFLINNDIPGVNFGETFGASALVGSRAQFRDAFAHFEEYSRTALATGQVTYTTFDVTPVPQSQIDVGRAMGGNAISPPDGAFAAINLATQFNAGVNSFPPTVQVAMDRMFAQMPPSPGKPLFLNEAAKEQNVFTTYGDYSFLKKTYQKYDPHRFNVRHTEGPVGL